MSARSNKRIGVAVLVIIASAALVVLVLSIFSNTQSAVVAPITSSVVTYSTDTPEETKPNPDEDWRGAPEDPKRIKIEAAGVDGLIQNVGVDQNNQIAVPTNVHVAGWFVDSVKPGEKGLSIIDGHVNGRIGDGVFGSLGQVSSGDTLTIEFGDGTVRKFTVFDKQALPVGDTASVLFSQEPDISHQLNLITCIGTYTNGTFDKRLVVRAKLAE